MKSYDELAREADAIHEAGAELDDLTPVRARVSKEVRAVFPCAFHPYGDFESTRERGQKSFV
jgi:hypothetical protein